MLVSEHRPVAPAEDTPRADWPALGWSRRFLDNAVGGLRVTEIKEPARKYATLTPPFIGVLTPQIIARSATWRRRSLSA
jgi:hypothetical protein